jgi:hypothetical protein
VIHVDRMTVVTVGDVASILKAVLEKADFFCPVRRAARVNDPETHPLRVY